MQELQKKGQLLGVGERGREEGIRAAHHPPRERLCGDGSPCVPVLLATACVCG